MEITVMQNVLKANEEKAQEIRELLKKKKVFMINIISSPGSGKTTFLEKTIPYLKNKYNLAIIEGDVASDKDAERLDKFGIPVAMVNTGGSCHIEAVSIEKAFTSFDLDALDLIIVENVGNLVCPAEFDIGEDMKIAMLSIPEGEDKPVKYPLLFRESKLVLINKIDLMPYLDFDQNLLRKNIAQVNNELPVLNISCKKEVGLQKWFDWIENRINKKKELK